MTLGQISKTQQLLGFRDLWLEGLAPQPPVRKVVITKSENEHEKASLFVPSRTQDFQSLLGARCSFSYGSVGSLVAFQGYVAEIVPQRTFTGSKYQSEEELVILGPTMVMKGNKPRFFSDGTVNDAIARLLRENRLGFSDETTGNPMSWRSLAQTSETDWEMVLKLADRIGCKVLSQRGVVRLLDYNDIAFRELPSHFLKMRSELPIRDSEDSDKGSLFSFTPVSLSSVDPTYRTPAMAFMEGGQAVYVNAGGRAGPVPRRFATDMPARSAREADALQQGYYYPNWNQTGEVSTAGDATIEPASVVQISSGSQVSSMEPEFDGLWYVSAATHQIFGNRFVTKLEMGRPATRKPNWYAARPFWITDRRGLPSLIPAGDGSWLSTWR